MTISAEPSTGSAGDRPQPPAATRREKTIVAVLAALALITTFAVFRPDRKLPFDFLDFSEFLALLQRDGSFSEHLGELLSYYSSQGRFNLIGYAVIAAKWDIWGDYSPGWQWTRFATMWVAVFLTFRLLRRLGVTRAGAVAGCSVFLFSPPAFDGWTRLTMAEPLGLSLLLVACLIALQKTEAPDQEWMVGLGFAVICAIIVLLKEMLMATLLLPVLLVASEDGLSASERPRRRLRTLLISMVAAVPIASAPVVLTAARASDEAYTSAFGVAIRPLPDAIAQWSLSILPFDPATSFPSRLTGVALLVFVIIIVSGWTVKLRLPDESRMQRRLLAIALLFPLVGTLSYLPWPSWNRFYSIPFLLSGAILAAIAFSAFELRSRRTFILACCAWGAIIASAAADSYGQANRLAARQVINREVVTRLATFRSFDTVVVATDQQIPAAWQGLGPTLERYGRSFGLDMPVVMNAPCQQSRARSASSPIPIVAYNSHCPGFATKDPTIVRYRRFRFPASMTTDSIRVDFVVPSARNEPAERLP